MAKYMGGGKKSPAERLRDKLIEKGFDAFIYESPLDALASALRQEKKWTSICTLPERRRSRSFVEKQDLIITLGGHCRRFPAGGKTGLWHEQGRRRDPVVRS